MLSRPPLSSAGVDVCSTMEPRFVVVIIALPYSSVCAGRATSSNAGARALPCAHPARRVLAGFLAGFLLSVRCFFSVATAFVASLAETLDATVGTFGSM